MPYGFYYVDPTYFLVLIGALLCLGASLLVNTTMGEYRRESDSAQVG